MGFDECIPGTEGGQKGGGNGEEADGEMATSGKDREEGEDEGRGREKKVENGGEAHEGIRMGWNEVFSKMIIDMKLSIGTMMWCGVRNWRC